MATTPRPQQAADPVKVDSKHYKVEFENERVRVLRINYGPRDKSVMHWHPDSIAIPLTDSRTRFTFPDGTSEEKNLTAGQALWIPGGSHLPENLLDKPFEVVLVEVKS